jgi:CRP-like cAMP-binding protein
MNEYDECVNELYKDLCGYKVQPLELREYLRENMSVRDLSERDFLFRKKRPITDALYVGRGFVATYGSSTLGDNQLLSIAKKRSILADFSFTSQEPSDYDLVGLSGSYVLGISFAHMEIIYERFPSTQDLSRLIMADTNRKEMERVRLLTRGAEKVVYDFYKEFPEFLPAGGLMIDADVASNLMISESTLRNVRAKLFPR